MSFTAKLSRSSSTEVQLQAKFLLLPEANLNMITDHKCNSFIGNIFILAKFLHRYKKKKLKPLNIVLDMTENIKVHHTPSIKTLYLLQTNPR